MSIAEQQRIAELERRLTALETIVSQVIRSKGSDPRNDETRPPEKGTISTVRETVRGAIRARQ